MRTASALALVATLAVAALPARADESISLAVLERRLPEDPAILAARADIDAAQASLLAERAKSGWYFTYGGSLGPTPELGPGAATYNAMRLSQNAGVGIPLFGTRTAQNDAILSAAERLQIAQIAVRQIQREHVASLRAAYIRYWQYDTETAIARTFAGDDARTLPQARALRETGFWTSTNMLDFLDATAKVTTDATTFAGFERVQLSQVDFAVGTEIPAFHPVRPDFFDACAPNRESALNSAISADTQLAQLSAQTAELRQELAAAGGSSIEGSVNLQAGTLTNLSQPVSGYGVHLSLNLSAPTHAAEEEHALRAAYAAQIQSLQLQQTQRKVELASTVDATLDALANDRTSLKQAVLDQTARLDDERKAVVRFTTIHQPGAVGFADMFEKREERYAADRASIEASANLLLSAASLLLLAPDACAQPLQQPIARSTM